MKLHQKTEPAKQAVAFISRHDDEPIEYRQIELDKVRAFIDAEEKAMIERAAEKVSESKLLNHIPDASTPPEDLTT